MVGLVGLSNNNNITIGDGKRSAPLRSNLVDWFEGEFEGEFEGGERRRLYKRSELCRSDRNRLIIQATVVGFIERLSLTARKATLREIDFSLRSQLCTLDFRRSILFTASLGARTLSEYRRPRAFFHSQCFDFGNPER